MTTLVTECCQGGALSTWQHSTPDEKWGFGLLLKGADIEAAKGKLRFGEAK